MATTNPMSLYRLVMALALLPSSAAVAYTPETPFDDAGKRSAQPALGINPGFGRWNGTVKVIYDPDQAPAQFPVATMTRLIESSFQQWEAVSGIDFLLVGTDANALDDDGASPGQQDGLVRLHWGVGNGFAGLAGPSFGSYSENLGYFPYADGDVLLNRDPTTWDGEVELINTLVHEFGHLIGLGHSENPLSVMYANPYNNLNFPRTDDIRAVQALYGTSQLANAAGIIAGWKFTPPPAAAASTLQQLFQPISTAPNGSFLSLELSPTVAITGITQATADNQYLQWNSGGISGSGSNAVAITGAFVLVDPDGFLRSKSVLRLECAGGFTCQKFFFPIETQVLKTYPGTWKVYILDETAGEANARLLLTQSVTVDVPALTINKAPQATVTAEAGATASQVRLTIAATDAEKHDITVIWHPPGPRQDRNGDRVLENSLEEALGSDGVAVQTINFSQTGTHTLFVELVDNGPRYSDAGDGFANLLKLTVNLPLNGVNGGVTLFAQHESAASGNNGGTGGTSGQTVLSKVAGAQTLNATGTAGASTASFKAGASADDGATTSTTFKSGNRIVVGGTITPQTADLGKPGELFVVIRAVLGGKESWLLRDSNGAFRPWNVQIPALVPAKQVSSLAAEVVEVYQGPVGVGTFQVFLGYKVSGSTALHFTAAPLSLNVSN